MNGFKSWQNDKENEEEDEEAAENAINNELGKKHYAEQQEQSRRRGRMNKP